MADNIATDSEIEQLVAALSSDNANELSELGKLLDRYPDDPRLYFMRGSLLASQSEPLKAHTSMKRAVELAPGYAIARYQLGFFELTSGEAEAALSTWGPLLAEAEDNYLRVFVEGMTFLIRDEFQQAIGKFEQGIALNQENEPLNNDIRLLIGEITPLSNGADGLGDDGESDDQSATSLILGQFGANRTIN